MERSDVALYKVRRKNFMVDRKFQTNFILKFCLLVAGTGLFCMVVLYALANKATTVSFLNSRVVVQTTADFIYPILIQTFITATVIVGIATIYITLFLSHRIAGPAYRFKKTLSALGEGNFSGDCKVRSKDSLQDVAKAINDMMGSVRKDLGTINGSIAKLNTRLGEAQKKQGLNEAELKELMKEALELDKALHHFKF